MRQRIFIYHYYLLCGLLAVLPACVDQSNGQREYKSSRAAQRAERRRELRQVEHNHTFSEMTFDELNAKYEEYRERDNAYLMVRYLERMIQLTRDHAIRKDLVLACGRAYVQLRRYAEARRYFEDFLMLYPGDTQVEEAFYQLVCCLFEQRLGADRDQTITQNTIDAADQFLEKRDVFTTYIDQVEHMRNECYKRLFEHEADVLQQKLVAPTEARITAARKRLEYINTEIVPHIQDDVSHVVAQLEQELAYAQEPTSYRDVIASLTRPKITLTDADAVDQTETTTVAQVSEKKKRYADRF